MITGAYKLGPREIRKARDIQSNMSWKQLIKLYPELLEESKQLQYEIDNPRYTGQYARIDNDGNRIE